MLGSAGERREAELVDAAENAMAFAAQPPGAARLDRREFILVDNPGPLPEFGSVQRLRLAEMEVERAIAEVRKWFRARERPTFTWWVGSGATPPNLVDLLKKRGARPSEDDPLLTVMILDAPPPIVTEVETRRVESLGDYVTYLEIRADAFGFDAEMRQQVLSRAKNEWEAYSATDFGDRFLAFIAGKPVASAFMVRTDRGLALLIGGATLPESRGRGAYRALVKARWDAAAACGMNTLVTHAGAESRPILSRLGFRELSTISILMDHTGA